MNITESPNDKLSISTSKFNLDKRLDSDKDPLPEPLANQSFIWALVAKPRSGKTTYLMSLLTKKKVKGIRQSYRGLFKNIIFVSPTIASLGDNKEINKLKYKYDSITLDVLDEIEEISRENKEDGEQTCVVFDDVSSEFKKNKPIIDKLSKVCKNHRHIGLSIFILSQKFTDLPTGMRNCLSHITLMNCDNMYERDSIFSELPIAKKNYDELYEYIFHNKNDENTRYNSMLLDMSRTKKNHILVYKNFNLLDF